MAKKKVKHLGKGLQALLGPVSEELAKTNDTSITVENVIPEDIKLKMALSEVELDLISPNPHQPRTHWDQEDLSDLVGSIKANGVVQPIILRKTATGYQLIAGERRWRASKIAGLDKIPAMIRDASESQMLELALVENIHRSDLNPLERAMAYQDYISQFNLTQSDAAERLGENRSVVANYLRLLDLPQDVKDMLVNKELSMGHARAILALPNDDLRRKLAHRAMAGRLSVREVERLVRRQLQEVRDGVKAKPEKSPLLVDLESRLRDQLGTKVQIKANKDCKKGKIIIDFFSIDEFDRLTEQMGISIADTQ